MTADKLCSITEDDLTDLKLNDDLFKLHMTVKSLTVSVENLENYMYTGMLGTPSKNTLNQLVQEITIWCNCIIGFTDKIRKNGGTVMDSLMPDDINGGD